MHPSIGTVVVLLLALLIPGGRSDVALCDVTGLSFGGWISINSSSPTWFDCNPAGCDFRYVLAGYMKGRWTVFTVENSSDTCNPNSRAHVCYRGEYDFLPPGRRKEFFINCITTQCLVQLWVEVQPKLPISLPLDHQTGHCQAESCKIGEDESEEFCRDESCESTSDRYKVP
eukprot:m.95655 g.95655  ORF g.95655 m.95655 type:complete len:172 (-) comp21934_c0_seq1:36-551(-)